MNLTLLRAPKRPGAFIAKDDNAISGADQYNDLTSHSFAFSFMADSGDITLPAREAEWLNRTPHQLPAGSSVHCTLFPWAQQQFAVSALRPAWYGGGTLIRIYEQTGKAGVLQLPEGVTAIAVKPDGRELDEEISPVEFHAFEIKTLRITPDRHEC